MRSIQEKLPLLRQVARLILDETAVLGRQWQVEAFEPGICHAALGVKTECWWRNLDSNWSRNKLCTYLLTGDG